MIRLCTTADVPQMITLAFTLNNQPEHYIAFCMKHEEAIAKSFQEGANHPDYRFMGCFSDDELIAFMGYYLDHEKQTADCCAMFAKDDFITSARALFDALLKKNFLAYKHHFFIGSKNTLFLAFLKIIKAVDNGNECLLELKRLDYAGPFSDLRVSEISASNLDQLASLHDETFIDVYVSGSDLVSSIGKNRRAWGVFDHHKLIGYGVLKSQDRPDTMTVEILAVDKNHRHCGLGRTLLKVLITEAFSDERVNTISLVVENLNTNAIKLYQHEGFSMIEENRFFTWKMKNLY